MISEMEIMRKGEEYSGTVKGIAYPDRGRLTGPEGERVTVKCTLPGQQITYRVSRKRDERIEGKLVSVDALSPLETEKPSCRSFPQCGGCLLQRMPYSAQLAMKEKELQELLSEVLPDNAVYDGILPSPVPFGYRNKMEFSFGTESFGGPLTLGLHKRGAIYDILQATDCAIAHPDMRLAAQTVFAYCAEMGFPHYHKSRNTGFLRHLLLRRSESEGALLIVLVTTSEVRHDFTPLKDRLLALPLAGRIAGILVGINDLPADMVQYQKAELLYGEPYLTERMLGLTFRISVFSFFQTNTGAAERMYGRVRDYLGSFAETRERKPVIYDLYSGTGTIAQIVSPMAERVYAVELVAEATAAAAENAHLNGIGNCIFINGDVLQKLDEIEEKPDFLILDPPREGIVPKALSKIMAYDVDHMIYISCKATSFVRDMHVLRSAGWEIGRWSLADLFPQTPHCEAIVSMSRAGSKR